MATQGGYRFLDPQALARVKNLSMVARGVVEGSISGLHASPLKGFSVEFAEHREYVPGDDIREPAFGMKAMSISQAYLKDVKR